MQDFAIFLKLVKLTKKFVKEHAYKIFKKRLCEKFCPNVKQGKVVVKVLKMLGSQNEFLRFLRPIWFVFFPNPLMIGIVFITWPQNWFARFRFKS